MSPGRAAVVTVLAFLVTPAVADARTHRFAASETITASLSVKPRVAGTLLRFARNRVSVGRRASGVITLRRGARAARVRVGRVRRLRVTLSAGAGRVHVVAGGSTAELRGAFVADDRLVTKRGVSLRALRTHRSDSGRPVRRVVPAPRALPAPVAGIGAKPTFFATGSIWNRPLAAAQPLDPNSASYVAELRRLASPVSAGGYGSSIMTTSYGVPIYTVGPTQPKVRVKLDQTNSPLLQAAFEQVPVPAKAIPAAGTDGNLAVWQPSTDTMWEFWRMTKQTDGWHAKWGGRKLGVSTDPGYYRDAYDSAEQLIERAHWGTTSGKLPLVAGIMTIAELRSGTIPHALSFALPETRKDVWSAPAAGTDGSVDKATAIPIGARFRIDPKLDIGALKLPPVVNAMAVAAQRYGMMVVNTSGGVGFRAEDPAQYGSNPYPELFGNTLPSLLMRQFPWASLRMLPLDLRVRGQ